MFGLALAGAVLSVRFSRSFCWLCWFLQVLLFVFSLFSFGLWSALLRLLCFCCLSFHLPVLPLAHFPVWYAVYISLVTWLRDDRCACKRAIPDISVPCRRFGRSPKTRTKQVAAVLSAMQLASYIIGMARCIGTVLVTARVQAQTDRCWTP